MNRWENKIAVVTGASSGIGAAIVKDLIKSKLIVVGLARRVEKIQQIRDDLPKKLQNHLYPLKCDVSCEMDVEKSFDWIIKTLGGVDILINNAGIYRVGSLATMDPKLVQDTINTNIMGIVYCTRLTFKNMQLRKVDGHIVNINSITGHKIPNFGGDLISMNIYPPTKYAVTGISETYRQEFSSLGTNIKLTSISPGLVATELVAKEIKNRKECLQSEDIANAVIFALSTPPHVQISELTIQPVGEKL